MSTGMVIGPERENLISLVFQKRGAEWKTANMTIFQIFLNLSVRERGEEEEGGKGRTTRDQKPCGKR